MGENKKVVDLLDARCRTARPTIWPSPTCSALALVRDEQYRSAPGPDRSHPAQRRFRRDLAAARHHQAQRAATIPPRSPTSQRRSISIRICPMSTPITARRCCAPAIPPRLPTPFAKRSPPTPTTSPPTCSSPSCSKRTTSLPRRRLPAARAADPPQRSRRALPARHHRAARGTNSTPRAASWRPSSRSRRRTPRRTSPWPPSTTASSANRTATASAPSCRNSMPRRRRSSSRE